MVATDRSDAPERVFWRFGSTTGLVHLPALDGLRGLAVLAVVAFHGHWSWARGGFLGVSLFFTLSGFLITSLLINEHGRTGVIDLTAFWGRRFRRLLPAAWLTLVAVTTTSIAAGELSTASRYDIWAALANVANWRFLSAGQSYNDLFSQPSPVLHFWSLAIEEQCYLLLPVVVGIALRFSRRRLVGVGAALGSLLALSIASTAVSSGVDRVYYGTDTRAAELLVGALLAVAVAHEPFRRRLALTMWPRWTVQALGTLALFLTVAAWVAVDVSDGIVSNGGLPVVAVLSALLVLTAAVGTGPVAALFSTAPLRHLGRISYGVYLFHWPIFVFLNERRTGLSHGPRFVLQVALALCLAELSHRWFEQPMRRPTLRLGSLTPSRIAPLVALALVAATLGAGSASATNSGFDADSALAELKDINRQASKAGSSTDDDAGSTPSVPGPAQVAAPPKPSFAIFGDSVALSLAYPVAAWALQSGSADFVGGDAELGCGIGRGGRQRAFGEVARTDKCDGWEPRWSAFIEQNQPDVAVVQSAQWELVERRLEGDDTWRTIGDPVYDEYLRNEFLAATDVLGARGALVVWVTVPQYSQLDDDGLPEAMRESHAPARVDRLNQIIADVVAARPATTRVIDLAAWMSDRIDDVTLRKDGSHFNSEGAGAVAEQFFGPQLVATWNDWFESESGPGGGSGEAGMGGDG